MIADMQEKNIQNIQYKCEVIGCNLTFERKCSLINHMKFHLIYNRSNDPKFQCKILNCLKSFCSKAHFIKHKKVHHIMKSNPIQLKEPVNRIFNLIKSDKSLFQLKLKDKKNIKSELNQNIPSNQYCALEGCTKQVPIKSTSKITEKPKR